jgi:PhnB protein
VQDPFGNHWYIATRLQSMLVPEGLGNVLPFLHPTSAARLVDFLERTFGGRELQRFEHGGRVVHTAVQIGNAVVEMGEPEEDRRQPAAFFVYVEDADAAYERALAAGATSLWPPADQPYGYRVAGVQDPFGYQWFPATPLPDRNR